MLGSKFKFTINRVLKDNKSLIIAAQNHILILLSVFNKHLLQEKPTFSAGIV